MKLENNKMWSQFFFVTSLISVAVSILVWVMAGPEVAHSERFGIFVGLWAPTLMTLALYFKE